ncbi:MAG: hypothetical protein CMK64_10045 [Pseudoalteromonas sp.]|nr:hypothetical protein [Pseudoalteromonas sp.]
MKTGIRNNWRTFITPIVFSLALSACGGGGSDGTDPTPTPTPENKAPTVSIAELQEAKEQEAFTLSATAADSDGAISKYEWSTDSALDFTLSGTDTNELTVTSPDISEDTSVTFKLVVTDNGSVAKTAEATQTVVIKRRVSSVTITGIVTDKPIANANITLSAGDSSVQVQAGTDGGYSGELVVDESEVKNLVQIKAQGIGEQSNVEFWSLLNSVETVITQAGDDGVLQKEENFSVNVTNVTTAEYAIISREGEIPKDDDGLKSALLNVDADEKLQLATLIKVVVDNPDFSLPEGVENTLQLVSSTETAQAFEAQVNEKDPTIIEKTKNEIKEDTDLVTGPTGTLVGAYILQSPRYYNNLAYHITLNADNTGIINGINEQTIANWELDGNKLSLTLAAPLKKSVIENTLDDQSKQRVETYVTSLSMLVLGENEVFRTVEVTESIYQVIDSVEQDPETVTYISNLTSKLQTAQPTAEILTAGGGVWYLDLDDRDYTINDDPEEQVSKLIFNADGTITTEFSDEEVTWRIEGRAIVVDYKDFTDDTKQTLESEGTASIWLTKVLGAGYQIVTLDTADDEWPNTEYGLLIKPSSVTVNKTTMSGRWHGFYGLNQSYYMDLYPDGSIYFGLERSDYVWDIDGNTMVRKVYMKNGSRVESCEEERDDCTLVGVTNHELLAMVNGRYYVKRTFIWMNEQGMMEVSESALFIFEYDSDLSITAFDQTLPNYGDTYVWVQDAMGNLMMVMMNRDSEEFDGVITFGERSYNFNFEGGNIVYLVDGAKYTLEIIDSSQEYIQACLYPSSGLTFDIAGEGSVGFHQVGFASSGLEGVWELANESVIFMFLPDNRYFAIQWAEENGFIGFERGAYTADGTSITFETEQNHDGEALVCDAPAGQSCSGVSFEYSVSDSEFVLGGTGEGAISFSKVNFASEGVEGTWGLLDDAALLMLLPESRYFAIQWAEENGDIGFERGSYQTTDAQITFDTLQNNDGGALICDASVDATCSGVTFNYTLPSGCTDDSMVKIWKQMPLMGNSIINNSDLYLGETLGLSLNRWGNGTVKTNMGEHEVYWYVAPEGLIEVNFQNPEVIYSNSTGSSTVEHKRYGYNIKLDTVDPMKVSVTDKVDVYTDGNMTGSNNHDFMANLYYERDFIDLSNVDFVGKWVAFDRADGNQISRVEFMADGTGNVTSTFDEPDEDGSFTWSVTDRALHLKFGDSEIDKIHLSKDLTVGYQFIDDYIDTANLFDSQIISGLLIKDMSPQLAKEDYVGRWVYFDGSEQVSGQNGTEIYPEDEDDSYLTFVFGTGKSSYQGRYEDGQVVRARYVNPNTQERTRFCEPSPTCVLEAEMRYQMVAEHEGRYFWAREFSNFDADGKEYPNSGVIFVGERNESTDIEKLEPYHLWFTMYQAEGSSSIAWSMTYSTNESDETTGDLTVGDGSPIPFTFLDGKLELVMDGNDTIIELVPGSNNKDGLTLCKYLKGNTCTAQDHVPLFFSPPN